MSLTYDLRCGFHCPRWSGGRPAPLRSVLLSQPPFSFQENPRSPGASRFPEFRHQNVAFYTKAGDLVLSASSLATTVKPFRTREHENADPRNRDEYSDRSRDSDWKERFRRDLKRN
ncbi:uncharacterized protein LOC132086197 isoform X2 [Ammospiza nelsoni]|uniref:uncharacterized protein LOC132086197 isoform X2 n=1 Tax=Ammospiza nelsoni TaxID=2857394 RepID=UPI00286BD8FD|nr:uncharacterized protein LOC132086197 isoform X2 [Ammospiza nelsoni]